MRVVPDSEIIALIHVEVWRHITTSPLLERLLMFLLIGVLVKFHFLRLEHFRLLLDRLERFSLSLFASLFSYSKKQLAAERNTLKETDECTSLRFSDPIMHIIKIFRLRNVNSMLEKNTNLNRIGTIGKIRIFLQIGGGRSWVSYFILPPYKGIGTTATVHLNTLLGASYFLAG